MYIGILSRPKRLSFHGVVKIDRNRGRGIQRKFLYTRGSCFRILLKKL